MTKCRTNLFVGQIIEDDKLMREGEDAREALK